MPFFVQTFSEGRDRWVAFDSNCPGHDNREDADNQSKWARSLGHLNTRVVSAEELEAEQREDFRGDFWDWCLGHQQEGV